VLTVFDAHNIKAGPMALARLPYRAPVCFHGNFLAT
jgi:carotenoid cleavage dioxygenase